VRVVEDLIEGADAREGEDGYACTRTFIVEGVTGNAHARQYEALRSSGIPARGDAHPSIPGLVVDDRVASALRRSTSAVKVTVTYRPLSPTEIADSGAAVMEVGATLTSETRDRDAMGKKVYKSRTDLTFDESGRLVGATTIYERVTFEVQVPTIVLTFRRKTRTNPVVHAETFLGKIGDWGRADAYLSPWLITRIDGKTEDGGQTYDELIEMQYKRSGWVVRIPRVVTATNAFLAPPDFDERDYVVPAYEAVAFDALGLPRPPFQPVVDIQGDPAPRPIPLEAA
jgi:hypothetical protein